MSDGDSTSPDQPRPSVFLSYASEDREAAKLIRDALPALGLEAWYDESALEGGDAWDQKIRKQIRDCDFFMPLVSAQTEARREGYFRREWRLAVERTLDMADDHIFLLPVVIDATSETSARVPERFLSVQWTRLPGGQPTPAFEALCRRLASGDAQVRPAAKSPSTRAARRRAGRTPPPPMPEFPKYDAQRKAFFGARILSWAGRSVWGLFLRLPTAVRVIAYLWIAGLVLQRGCSVLSPPHREATRGLTPAQQRKIEEISESYRAGPDKADVAKLAATIARNFPGDSDEAAGDSALLAVPFTAPPGNAAAKNLADAAFAQVYGRVAISHRGKVALPDGPLPSDDMTGALVRGREQHAKYILYGAVETPPGVAMLNVKLVSVADASAVWSGSYPVAGADPAKIAADVDAKVPKLEDD